MKDFLENNINIVLNNIFKNRFNIDLFNNENDLSIDDNLLGSKFELRARDLIYLLYDVEKEFNIIISEEDIGNIKFNTVNNILAIINLKLEEKEMKVV